MEPPCHPDIDEAADELKEIRAKRMRLTEEETTASDSLLALMHKHDLKTYEYEGGKVEVAALEKVKVRKKKPEANGDDED
jgi:inorganic pyrophosphatase/exopolyphosphatase